MLQQIIESLLEDRIGLSADIVGSEVIVRAVRNRMNVCEKSDESDYFAYLRTSEKEWQELVETVVIPETWFFRNRTSFAFLKHSVRSEWLPTHKEGLLRALSIPCSTGEEPYSMAITLLEAGLPPSRFHIDAIDISNKALQKARSGVYGPESFRGKDNFSFRERYFDRIADNFQVHSFVKDTVRFVQGNLLDERTLSKEEAYDVIFCRNVLIYLTSTAKSQAISVINRSLVKTGILFVGHAERPAFNDVDFEWIRQTGIFACRRADTSHGKAQARKHSFSVRPQNRVKPLVFPTFERRKPRGDISRTPQTDPVSPEDSQKNAILPEDNSKSLSERRQRPDDTLKLLDTARELADQGSLEEAMTLCEKVLDKNVGHVQAYFLKGLIYQALDEEENAENSLNKTIYLDPNHYDALNHLAFIAEYRGEREKATLLRRRMERIRKD